MQALFGVATPCFTGKSQENNLTDATAALFVEFPILSLPFHSVLGDVRGFLLKPQ